MAREFTAGFAAVGQIAEPMFERIVQRNFLRQMPKVERQVGGVLVQVWFDTPEVKLLPSVNPLLNLVEVRVPFVARTGDRFDETLGVLTVTPSLTQTEEDGLVAPMLDFRGAAGLRLTVDKPPFEAAVRGALTAYLAAQSPIVASPLFPGGGNAFFKNFVGATRADNVFCIFLDDGVGPALPNAMPNRAGASIMALVPRERVEESVAAARAAQGIAALPCPVPGQDGMTLKALSIELKVGHVYLSGTVETDGLFGSEVQFEAWLQLWAAHGSISINVLRTRQDGGVWADFLDFVSGGAVTRMLEEAIPAAVRNLGGGAFSDLGLFAREVPVQAAFVAAEAFGNVLILPEGIGVPVILLDADAVSPERPPYLRVNVKSREFHVPGCRFGDRILTTRLRRFPTWQAAVAAGCDGCATCQPAYNVAAYGNLEVLVAGPVGAAGTPEVVVRYAGNASRFGVPLGRIEESDKRPTRSIRGGQVVYRFDLRRIVPGPWDLRVSWDGWATSGSVVVDRRWRDAAGAEQGQDTAANVTFGQAPVTVVYG